MRRAGPRQRPRQTDEAAPLLRTRYRTPPSLSSVECRVNQGCIQMNGGEFPHQKRGFDVRATRKQIGGIGSQVMQRGPRSNELGSSPRVPCLPETTTRSSHTAQVELCNP